MKPGDRVGIYLHKSPSAIASIFGIMKTGACYVPVDANAPGLRLLEIGRQCDFRALITSHALYQKLDATFHHECPMNAIFFVDQAPEAACRSRLLFLATRCPPNPAENPEVEVIDHDLAYILFTSGSTGTPKGVMLSHLNALTFVNWSVATFGITADDRLSNHAPFNFDLSVFDIFVAVKAGAAISLVPEGLSVFPLQLSSFIQDQKITVWYSVPMVLTLLQARGKLEQRDLSALRLGPLCRRSLSDQTPACADGKAAGQALRESLWTDRDQRLRLLRSGAALVRPDRADPDRQSLRQYRSHCH